LQRHPHHSSAEAFDDYVPGQLIASSRRRPWKDLLVQIFDRHAEQDTILLPAVPEPLIVWILTGSAMVEERELGGEWKANRVEAGDFFLTSLPRPTELRWKALSPAPFRVMHLYLSLPLVKRAVADVLRLASTDAGLREVSGANDPVLSSLLEHIRRELASPHPPSEVFVQGISQSIAVHLVRHYADPAADRREHRGGLPAHKLQTVLSLLQRDLAAEFRLAQLARAAGLSEYHFSRAFKQSTGLSPSRFFIRLRMERARRLLRETDASIIDIGLQLGYASPSHFAQVFRAEAGVTPTRYRESGLRAAPGSL
jgi:AraC family transcriptional regulator